MAVESRHLSAVMLTDLVGYTSLTQRDEAGALRLLEEHRQVVRPLLRDHSGREVKTIGDAFLVEFGNALDATRCAIAIQQSLHQRNSKSPRAKIELRIGLHVGDVVRENGDIYGDAVNLVSRIEPLAEPGGICVSGSVFELVRNKLDMRFEALGTPALKNVEFPVALYRIELPWLVTSLAPKTPWVDRPAEQRVLREAVEQARKGEGCALLLVGESGVGKTRLAEEAVRAAERSGFRVLRGRAFPDELATPYAHWAEMVREYLGNTPPAVAYKAMGAAVNEWTKLVPELGEKFGPTSERPGGDPESARARFYATITQFFVDLSEEAPLILLFDDLQWADLASLRLLEFALRAVPRHRMLILGTMQEIDGDDGAAVAETLRYLRKDEMLRVVPVRRMDAVSVGEMIGKIFGELEVSEEFRTHVHERTGGNPFFVEEILRSLVEEGTIYRTPEGRWERKGVEEIRIPKTVREVVKQRASRLDEPTLSTLRVAAVLGTEFASELLREVAGIEDEPLIEQLERLVRAGLLTETKTASPFLTFAFSDPRLRDALYSEVLSLRRVRLHRKAAEALEKLSGNRREEFAAELAHHFEEGHDPAQAAEYALVTAHRCANVYGFEEAETHYRTALKLLEEAPDDQVRARALDGLGTVHFALGRVEEALPEWEAAVRLYESTGEARRAGGLCPKLADLVRTHPQLARGEPQRGERWIEQGRRLLESIPPTPELAELYDQAGIYLTQGGRLREGRALLDKGVGVARAIGDADAEASVQGDFWFTYSVREKEQVVPSLEESVRQFSRPGKEHWTFVAIGYSNLSVVGLAILGDPAKAVEWAERVIDSSQKVRDRLSESEGWLRKARAQIWMGRTREAEASLRQGRERRGLGIGAHDVPIDLVAADLALARGDLDGAAALLSRAMNSESAIARRRAAPDQGELHRQRHEIDAAEAVLRRASEGWPASLEEMPAFDAWYHLRGRAALVETLLERPREDERRREVERLAADVHQLAVVLENPAGLGIDLRLQGILAAQAGRGPESIARLEEAVGQFRKASYVVELPRTLELLARAYREGGQAEKARESEAESVQLFRELRGGPREVP